jgi:signal transduction histidine kinase
MKPPGSRTRGVLLYLAGWVPLFLFCVALMRQTAAPTFGHALLYTITYLLPAVAAGALAWRLALRLPWRRLPWIQFCAIELALALGFTVAWNGAFFGLLWLQAGPAVMRSVQRQTGAWQLLFGLVIYGMHAAIFHALRVSGELRRQEIAAAEAESLRVRAEMEALRGQLNPHFLFNSLHSITALVRSDPPRAEEALLQFAGLLRRVLELKRETADEVSLAEELAFVDDYLAIERLRLGGRLRVNRTISPEALTCRLPAFSVQPLVENALRYAVAPRRDGGTVILDGAVRDGRLEFTVADDGPGADPATIAAASGVGLSVIRRRLQLRYGDRAAFSVDTAQGKGFRVTLALPAVKEDAV